MAESRGCPFYPGTQAFLTRGSAAPDAPPSPSAPPPADAAADELEDYDEQNSRLAEAGLVLLGLSSPALCVSEVTG